MKVKTSELSGVQLDWAVSQSVTQKYFPVIIGDEVWLDTDYDHILYSPSTNWSQCGALIDCYQIALIPEAHNGRIGTEMSDLWYANVYFNGSDEFTTNMCGSPLIAACRAVVGMKFGDEVEIPNELMEVKG